MYDHVYKYTTPKVRRKYADLHARVGGVSHLPQHPSGASFPSVSSSSSNSLRTFSIASLSMTALRLFRLIFSLCSARTYSIASGSMIALCLFGTSFFRASLDAFGSFVTRSVLASAIFAFFNKATLPFCLRKAGTDFRLSFLGIAGYSP